MMDAIGKWENGVLIAVKNYGKACAHNAQSPATFELEQAQEAAYVAVCNELRTTPEGFALMPVGVAALHTNMKTTTSTQPDWHDAPTCAGDWLCVNLRTYEAALFTLRGDFLDERWVNTWRDGSRYFGPLPPDTKASDAT